MLTVGSAFEMYRIGDRMFCWFSCLWWPSRWTKNYIEVRLLQCKLKLELRTATYTIWYMSWACTTVSPGCCMESHHLGDFSIVISKNFHFTFMNFFTTFHFPLCRLPLTEKLCPLTQEALRIMETSLNCLCDSITNQCIRPSIINKSNCQTRPLMPICRLKQTLLVTKIWNRDL
jgi:hypothetical protein